jgi:ABC-type polysaccharide/polyol phosphate export permease
MKETLRELYRHRGLLYVITHRDIRIKYKQSVMGLLWAILMPALIVAAGILVKYAYAMAAKRPLDWDDAASVSVKSIPWAFLVASIRFGSNSLISNTNLVTKIYFPREIFPFAAVCSQLFDLAVASVVLTAVLSFAGIGLSWQLLWVPTLLAILILFATGVSTIVSAASLFFRDVKYIVEVALTFGIFFTPVFYEVELLGPNGDWLLLNPAAPLLEGLRDVVVLHQPPDLPWIGYSAVVSVIGTIAAYALFKRLEPSFAECI